MPHMLSVQLDITARRIVIVGGGAVASRKAAAVLAAGARDVTAIAPAFAADFPPAVRRIDRLYDAALLAGASLVFAATDRQTVNDAVVRDARAIGALVNRADDNDALPGDFTLPAKADLGDIRVTVSAGSAALSAAIRDRLVEQFDPRWTALAAAMKTLRPWIVGQTQLTPAERTQIFRDLAGDAALHIGSDIEALQRWIQDRYPRLTGSPASP